MRIQFKANNATFDEICGNHVACLAIADGSLGYLIFQRTSSTDPDKDSGIFLEYNEVENSSYNIIKECRVSRYRLSVDLKTPFDSLINVEGFDITLNISELSFSRLINGMKTIFRDDSGNLLSIDPV